MKQRSFDSCRKEFQVSDVYVGRQVGKAFPLICTVAGTFSEDLMGVDWVCTSTRGVPLGIDVKMRAQGCSEYWRQGPELSLEVWHDRTRTPFRRGWVQKVTATDWYLFVYHDEDSKADFLVPAEALKRAFQIHQLRWMGDYEHPTQPNKGYLSQCVFVPVSELRACGVLVTELHH